MFLHFLFILLNGTINELGGVYVKITGRFEELYFFFQKAADSNAELIHFAPNGDVWILYSTESYVYLRSQLDITHSVYFPKNAIRNMHSLCKRSKSDSAKARRKGISFPLEIMEIAPEYLQFDHDRSLRTNVFTKMERGTNALDLSDRLKRLSYSVVELDKPYIRITPGLIKKYMRQVSQSAKSQGFNFKRNYTFDPHADETRNLLHMHEYDFAITRAYHEEEPIEDQMYTFDEGYFVPRFFYGINIFLSDSDLLILSRIGQVMNIEEFYVIPFANHYVIESHDGEMLMKMAMPRVKRMELSNML